MYENKNNVVNNNVNMQLVKLLVKDWELWTTYSGFISKHMETLDSLVRTDVRGNWDLIQEYKALLDEYRDARAEAKAEYLVIWDMLNDSEKLLASLLMINKM